MLMFFRALYTRLRADKPHDENLRAGQYRERTAFSPWTAWFL